MVCGPFNSSMKSSKKDTSPFGASKALKQPFLANPKKLVTDKKKEQSKELKVR